MKKRTTAIATIFSLFLIQEAWAADGFRMSVGLDYSSGKYGSSNSTDIWSTSLGGRYKTGRWTIKGSLPYIQLKGSGATGPDGVPLSGGAGQKTERGLGDLQLSVANLVYYDVAAAQGVSVKAKVKVPTASRAKGLGTGKADVSLQLDPFKVVGKVTFFGTVGYKVYGDPSATDYRNVWYGHAGAMYKSSKDTDVGFSASMREKVTATSVARKNLSLFAVKQWDKKNKLQAYFLKGFSRSTADVGAGLLWMHSY